MPRKSSDAFGVGRMEGRDKVGMPPHRKTKARAAPKSSAKKSIMAGYSAGPKKGRARGGQYKYQLGTPTKVRSSNTMGSPGARSGNAPKKYTKAYGRGRGKK